MQRNCPIYSTKARILFSSSSTKHSSTKDLADHVVNIVASIKIR